MADRFPTYDVLAKRTTLSWNDKTRAVVDHRIDLHVPEDVLTQTQLATLHKLVQRVCPDPPGRPPTTTLAMIVRRIDEDRSEGFRPAGLPRTAECWRGALNALEGEARARYAVAFGALSDCNVDIVLRLVSLGNIVAPEWSELPPKLVWWSRLLPDLVAAHWSQPSLWSTMGFGGPAAPRGYVRMAIDRRDPWEAIEAGEPLRGLPRHRG